MYLLLVVLLNLAVLLDARVVGIDLLQKLKALIVLLLLASIVFKLLKYELLKHGSVCSTR